MKFLRTSPFTAGLATVVASGILVATPASTATAASTAANYTCAVPVVGDRTFQATYTIALLPPEAPAGFPVTAGLLSSDATLAVPADIAGLLSTLSVDGGRADDFTTQFGATVIKSPIVFDKAEAQDDATVAFSGKGKNAAFRTPQAGSYKVTMPKTFTLAPTSADTTLPFSIICTTATPGTLGTTKLAKQSSVVSAKAPKSVKRSAKARVEVRVTNDYSAVGGTPVLGKVVAKEGKRVLGKATVKNGKAVLKLAKLKTGVHKVVVTYGGDGSTSASKRVVEIAVKK